MRSCALSHDDMLNHVNNSVYDVQDFIARIVNDIHHRRTANYGGVVRIEFKTTQLYRPLTISEVNEMKYAGQPLNSQLDLVINRTPKTINCIFTAQQVKSEDSTDFLTDMDWLFTLEAYEFGSSRVVQLTNDVLNTLHIYEELHPIDEMGQATQSDHFSTILDNILNFYLFHPLLSQYLVPTFAVPYHVPNASPELSERLDVSSFHIFGAFDSNNSNTVTMFERYNDSSVVQMPYAGSLFESFPGVYYLNPVNRFHRVSAVNL